MSNPQSARDAAVSILASLRATYAAPLESVPAAEADFTHLDLMAYGHFRSWAEGEGLRYLGDLEFPALTNNPTTVIARSMVRTHVSADGTIAAEYYQVKPRAGRVLAKWLTGLKNLRWIAATAWTLRVLKTRHCLSLDSEFDDGSFVVTSNAEAAGLLSMPPAIDAKFFPYDTSRQVLLDSHIERVQAKIAAGRHASRAADLAAVLAQHRRMTEQKRVYRAALDWISKAELEAMSSNRAVADAVYAEMKELLTAEQPGDAQTEQSDGKDH
jgi:hypothetical protein